MISIVYNQYQKISDTAGIRTQDSLAYNQMLFLIHKRLLPVFHKVQVYAFEDRVEESRDWQVSGLQDPTPTPIGENLLMSISQT